MSAEQDALRRAHAFIAEVEKIVTDEPEFAGVRIADLFATQGQQIAADRAPAVLRRLSRDPEHIRADLEAGLTHALERTLGQQVTDEHRAKATAIVERTRGFQDSQRCLMDTLETFGERVCGVLLIHNIMAGNSLSGQSEVMVAKHAEWSRATDANRATP